MKNLRHLSLNELAALGEKSFRARQIHEWIWQKHVRSIDDMSNLPLALRNRLKEEYDLFRLEIDHTQLSNDGTIKNRFVLHDGHFVEGVLIPTETRMTACVSSSAVRMAAIFAPGKAARTDCTKGFCKASSSAARRSACRASDTVGCPPPETTDTPQRLPVQP